MNKTYSRINWENYPSGNTPINDENLNKMDRSINDIDNRVLKLDEVKATKEEVAPLIRDVQFNESTGTFTITRKNGSLFIIDTKLEKIAINWTYDVNTQQIILTLDDGTKQYIDLSALITQYEFLDTDTINFQVQADGTVKAIVKDGSITEDKLQPNYLAQIKVESAKAQISEANAANSAKKAESWAHGNTGVRPEESTNNSKYWSEQAKQAYNDFLNAEKVTGVKGNSEAAYRTGNVNITPENIGALSLYGGNIYNDNDDSLSISPNGLQGDGGQILSDFYKVESRTVKANVLYYNEQDTDNRYLKVGDDIIGNFTVQSNTNSQIQPLKVRDERIDIFKYNKDINNINDKSTSAIVIDKTNIKIGNKTNVDRIDIQSNNIAIEGDNIILDISKGGDNLSLSGKTFSYGSNTLIQQLINSSANYGVFFNNSGVTPSIITNYGFFFPSTNYIIQQGTGNSSLYLGHSTYNNDKSGNMPTMPTTESEFDVLLKLDSNTTSLRNDWGMVKIYGKSGVSLNFDISEPFLQGYPNSISNQVKITDRNGRYFGINILDDGNISSSVSGNRLGIFVNGDLFFSNNSEVTNLENVTEEDKNWLLENTLQNMLIELHHSNSSAGGSYLPLSGGFMDNDATVIFKSNTGIGTQLEFQGGTYETNIRPAELILSNKNKQIYICPDDGINHPSIKIIDTDSSYDYDENTEITSNFIKITDNSLSASNQIKADRITLYKNNLWKMLIQEGTIQNNTYNFSIIVKGQEAIRIWNTDNEQSITSGSNSKMFDIGKSSNTYKNIYAQNGIIQTSDRTRKVDINSLDAQKVQAFINGLNPVSYKMLDGTSGRTHYGLIAQDIEELMNTLNMDSKDFAGFIKSPKKITKYEDENGNKLKNPIEEVVEGEYDYSLRYDEFIAPLIKVVQEQQKEIEKLKEIIAI